MSWQQHAEELTKWYEAAIIEAAILRKELLPLLAEARELLTRYRMETPLGHQPAMIANRADAVIAKLNAAIGEH